MTRCSVVLSMRVSGPLLLLLLVAALVPGARSWDWQCSFCQYAAKTVIRHVALGLLTRDTWRHV